MPDARREHPKVRAELNAAMAACVAADVDPIGAEVEAHYTFINSVVSDCVREQATARQFTRTDRIDRVVTHRVWGKAIFVVLMALMFWAIFSWAAPVMRFLSDDVVGVLGSWMRWTRSVSATLSCWSGTSSSSRSSRASSRLSDLSSA